ncbi:MAG: hypothetical protein ABEK59_09390 [Halobacteria archaeon]
MKDKLGVALSVVGGAMIFLIMFLPWGLTAAFIAGIGTVLLSIGTVLFGVGGKSRAV